MEAMWSRFLPAIAKAKEWVSSETIGELKMLQCSIGFATPGNPENRYWNKDLGGGTANDILSYAYEISDEFLPEIPEVTDLLVHEKNGVDAIVRCGLESGGIIVDLMTSFLTPCDEKLVLMGTNGIIEIPHPHFAKECSLYDRDNHWIETWHDDGCQNGFVYEIKEVMRCVSENKLESPKVPHDLNLRFALIQDKIIEKAFSYGGIDATRTK